MKRLVFFVLAVLVIGVLLSGCVDNKGGSNVTVAVKEPELKVVIKNITTEKPSYTANELILISTQIESSRAFKNATLRVHGITSRQGVDLFDDIKRINLTKGLNTINLTVTSPLCTHGCGARYYPGDYVISGQLSYPNESMPNITITSNFTATVTLN